MLGEKQGTLLQHAESGKKTDTWNLENFQESA
jgi:hypothetical protein